MRSDVSRRAQWEVTAGGGDPPINPKLRHPHAVTAAIAGSAAAAQDRPWRKLLNSAPMGGLLAP